MVRGAAGAVLARWPFDGPFATDGSFAHAERLPLITWRSARHLRVAVRDIGRMEISRDSSITKATGNDEVYAMFVLRPESSGPLEHQGLVVGREGVRKRVDQFIAAAFPGESFDWEDCAEQLDSGGSIRYVIDDDLEICAAMVEEWLIAMYHHGAVRETA